MKFNIEIIFDIVVGLGYKVNLCVIKFDIEIGLFKFKENENISIFIIIEDFIDIVYLLENILFLIVIDDYYFVIDDYGGILLGIKEG